MIKKVFKNKILYIEDDVRVEYKKGTLRFIYKNGKIWKTKIFQSYLTGILSKFNLTERLLRLEPRTLIKVGEDIFLLSYQGAMFKINTAQRTITKIYSYADGTKNPLCFCHYDRANSPEIVFGDYGGHDQDGNIGIYRVTIQKQIIVKQIAAMNGNILNHIHRVEYDKYRDCYWIFTGDCDAGCGIWTLPYEGGEAKPYLVGKQMYRACVAYVNKSDILYATDSPIEKNHIYLVKIENKEIRELGELPGSCIFGMKISGTSDRWCFATAVEPDSTLSKWRYRLTYRLGKGIQSRYSYLYFGTVDKGFKPVWRAKKDNLPMWMFQFGNIRFPVQYLKDRLYFCPQSCSKNKGTYEMRME